MAFYGVVSIWEGTLVAFGIYDIDYESVPGHKYSWIALVHLCGYLGQNTRINLSTCFSGWRMVDRNRSQQLVD